MKTISRERAKRLLAAPDGDCPTGLRNRIIMRLAYQAGLRVQEIIAARVQDVSEDGRTLTVGEGGARREVGLADELRSDLRRWIHLHHPGGEWLVCNVTSGHEGGQVSDSYIRQMVSREARAARLDHRSVSPSILRDTFGAQLADEGWSVTEIATVMGFVDPRAARKFARTTANVTARMAARNEQQVIGGLEPDKPEKPTSIGELVNAAGGDRRDLARALVEELGPEIRDLLRDEPAADQDGTPDGGSATGRPSWPGQAVAIGGGRNA